MDRRKTDRRAIKRPPQRWEIEYPFTVDDLSQQCLFDTLSEDCKNKPTMLYCSCPKCSPWY